MSARTQIDMASALIGYDHRFAGLAAFRADSIELGEQRTLALRVTSWSGTSLVCASSSSKNSRELRLDRNGQLIFRMADDEINPELRLLSHPIAHAVGGDLRSFTERGQPSYECASVYTEVKPSDSLAGSLSSLLELRGTSPGQTALALRAASEIGADGLRVGVAVCGKELLPELFLESRGSLEGSVFAASDWASWLSIELRDVLAQLAVSQAGVVLSPELGLGVSFDLSLESVLEIEEAAKPRSVFPIGPGATAHGAFAIMAALAENDGSAVLRAKLHQELLARPRGPLPGLVPSAVRAHARSVARAFAKRGRLEAPKPSAAQLKEQARAATRVGLLRAVVPGAPG